MTMVRKIDLAKELGVGPSTITGYVAKGMPVAVTGLIDREEALRWIQRNVEAQIGGRKIKGGAKAGALLRRKKRHAPERTSGNGTHAALLDPAQERARRDAALARKYEREEAIAEGRVVLIEAVGEEVAAALQPVRSAILAAPSKLAPRLTMKPTQAVFDELTRWALEALAALSGLPGGNGGNRRWRRRRGRVGNLIAQ